jgi:hypothetical protein
MVLADCPNEDQPQQNFREWRQMYRSVITLFRKKKDTKLRPKPNGASASLFALRPWFDIKHLYFAI